MKKLLLILFFIPFISFSQNDEVNALLKTISNKYDVEDGNILLQKVIELDNISKDNIYLSVKEYLTNNYGSFKEVLQVDDKENGIIIIKGLFSDIYCTEIFLGSSAKYNIWHIFKIDIKENRIRLTISMNKIDVHIPATQIGSSYVPSKNNTEYLTQYYPVYNSDLGKKWKTRQGYVFYKAINRALNTIDSMGLFIKNSSLKTRQNDDW